LFTQNSTRRLWGWIAHKRGNNLQLLSQFLCLQAGTRTFFVFFFSFSKNERHPPVTGRRTLVSWAPRHLVTHLPRRTPNESIQSTKSSPLSLPVKTRRGHRYRYSSRETPDTLHGIGEGRERERPTSGKLWDLSTNTNMSLWGGSRQRTVESYIFGSQPRVQKGTSSRGGKSQDVKTRSQVSKEVEVLSGVRESWREWVRESREGEYRLRMSRVGVS